MLWLHEEAKRYGLPFSSLTNYQYAHILDINRSYRDTTPDAVAEWTRVSEKFDLTCFPHVSIGWDNNPRHLTLFKPKILRDNTPKAFEEALRAAKHFAQCRDIGMITINSWNEWTEGSYLLPDDVYGTGYLDAVQNVFIKE